MTVTEFEGILSLENSEQIPSAVGLGVLMNKDNTVRQAGGFIIQLMPFTSDEVIDELEKKIAGIKPVTEMLDSGMTDGVGHINVDTSEDTEQSKDVQTLGCTDCSRTPLACSVPTLHQGLDDYK